MTKQIESIKKIAVVGAGTMGSGIAQVAAMAGYETVLYDLDKALAAKGLQSVIKNLESAVEKKKISVALMDETLGRIRLSDQFGDLKADVIIEAIIEKAEIKAELFNRLAGINESDSIFCTNTSSIPITLIASKISRASQLAGMHFFNPAHIMKLVEVVRGKKTSAEVAGTVYQLAIRMGKEPVMVNDSPGFIVNRIGKLFHTEPLKILEEEIASIENIDALLESSGFKLGPFRLIDLIGVDANLNVTASMYEQLQYHPKFKPSELQQEMVKDGLLGRKSGRGFYRY